MTFLEWLAKERPEELPNQVMLLKDAWELGQTAERERIKQIVRDVTEGRGNCNLLLERIGE